MSPSPENHIANHGHDDLYPPVPLTPLSRSTAMQSVGGYFRAPPPLPRPPPLICGLPWKGRAWGIPLALRPIRSMMTLRS